MNEEEFPKRITVSKVISYDVADIVAMLRADNGSEPTIEDVIEQIEEWVQDDFSCGWGHKASVKELIFTDENGEEV